MVYIVDRVWAVLSSFRLEFRWLAARCLCAAKVRAPLRAAVVTAGLRAWRRTSLRVCLTSVLALWWLVSARGVCVLPASGVMLLSAEASRADGVMVSTSDEWATAATGAMAMAAAATAEAHLSSVR